MEQKNSIPRFPNYRETIKEDGIVLETIIRKQKEGIWYDLHIKEYMVLKESEPNMNNLSEMNKRFLRAVYNKIIFYKIDENYEKSECQLSEEDRLRANYPTLMV